MAKRGISLFKGLLLLLFPPACVGCGALMPWREGQDEVFCPVCRKAWKEGFLSPDEVMVYREDAPTLISLMRYRSGQTTGIPEKLIYHLKHKNERRVFSYVAKYLSPILQDAVAQSPNPDREIILTYPPRRPSAVRKEGFDQARELAKALAKETGWSVEALLLRTRKGKDAQKTLTAEERKANASAAYAVDVQEGELADTTVILVDDVHTTGATLHTCAALLKAAGAAEIFFVTVGRTVGNRAENGGM